MMRMSTSPLVQLVKLNLFNADGIYDRHTYHFRDIHTTMLHQLGLNQDDLSYLHIGRKERLTQVHGRVIQEIV